MTRRRYRMCGDYLSHSRVGRRVFTYQRDLYGSFSRMRHRGRAETAALGLSKDEGVYVVVFWVMWYGLTDDAVCSLSLRNEMLRGEVLAALTDYLPPLISSPTPADAHLHGRAHVQIPAFLKPDPGGGAGTYLRYPLSASAGHRRSPLFLRYARFGPVLVTAYIYCTSPNMMSSESLQSGYDVNPFIHIRGSTCHKNTAMTSQTRCTFHSVCLFGILLWSLADML